jgi:class 3 adenylate cyclase
MPETRKLAAILAADVVGYSKLAGSDEERTLARLRALRSDLIDPTIALHHGRVVKRTGDESSLSSEASSMPFAAPSRCRTVWLSATRVFRLSAASR